jgi:outer membrane lipoprotein SlyB
MVHDCGRFLILALCCLGCLRADAQGDTQRGVAVGGITGAIAGGLIGDHNGEAGAGAAIGGLIGAVTGGLIGNASDKEAQFQRQQALAYQHQQQLAHQQSAVSVQDVVSMSRSGLSDVVIINQINQRGVRTQLQVPDIISLHQQGVSEPVISAMQQAPTGAVPVARFEPAYEVVQPVPVIVQEHYVLPHYAPPRRYYYHRPAYHHHHRHSYHIGF